MRAIRFTAFGGPDNLELVDVPQPQPAHDDVLVRVAYCGVNPIDRSALAGRFPWLALPHTPGSEVAGVVESAGSSVTHVRAGDRVALSFRLFCGHCHYCLLGREEACAFNPRAASAPYGYGLMTEGGYADYIVVPGANALPVPDGVALDSATCAALDGLTSWHMIDRAGVAPGDRVLVMGASGGLGLFSMQIARLRGAEVIAVTSHPEDADQMKRLGASTVLDRKSQDIVQIVRELTGGRGVDVVLDPIGPSTWDTSMSALAPLGKYVTCGILTGPEVTLKIPPFYAQQQSIVGSTGGTRADLAAVLDTMARGDLEAVIWKTYPLAEASLAMQALTAPERVGKVLLRVDFAE